MKEPEDEFIMVYSLDTREILNMDIGTRILNKALTNLWIRTKVTTATTLAQDEQAKEYTVFLELANYVDIFEKKKLE